VNKSSKSALEKEPAQARSYRDKQRELVSVFNYRIASLRSQETDKRSRYGLFLVPCQRMLIVSTILALTREAVSSNIPG
jgi:hypothetical protein